ncbi:hypothetical protein AAF712_015548 [Marasmius tenuissimus]|uniref:Uncharacterized protein n=1 Tax=Marasmius tenuissimus TaxID=585030 RepID=A0ABR2Z8Y9_9AGAR
MSNVPDMNEIFEKYATPGQRFQRKDLVKELTHQEKALKRDEKDVQIHRGTRQKQTRELLTERKVRIDELHAGLQQLEEDVRRVEQAHSEPVTTEPDNEDYGESTDEFGLELSDLPEHLRQKRPAIHPKKDTDVGTKTKPQTNCSKTVTASQTSEGSKRLSRRLLQQQPETEVQELPKKAGKKKNSSGRAAKASSSAMTGGEEHTVEGTGPVRQEGALTQTGNLDEGVVDHDSVLQNPAESQNKEQISVDSEVPSNGTWANPDDSQSKNTSSVEGLPRSNGTPTSAHPSKEVEHEDVSRVENTSPVKGVAPIDDVQTTSNCSRDGQSNSDGTTAQKAAACHVPSAVASTETVVHNHTTSDLQESRTEEHPTIATADGNTKKLEDDSLKEAMPSKMQPSTSSKTDDGSEKLDGDTTREGKPSKKRRWNRDTPTQTGDDARVTKKKKAASTKKPAKEPDDESQEEKGVSKKKKGSGKKPAKEQDDESEEGDKALVQQKEKVWHMEEETWEAVEKYLRDPRPSNRLETKHRTHIRESAKHCPTAGKACWDLSCDILTTKTSLVKCIYHQTVDKSCRKWDETGQDEMTGTPYAPTDPTDLTSTRNPSDQEVRAAGGIVYAKQKPKYAPSGVEICDCGCLLEDAIWGLFLWKTGEIAYEGRSQGYDSPPTPRNRGFEITRMKRWGVKLDDLWLYERQSDGSYRKRTEQEQLQRLITAVGRKLYDCGGAANLEGLEDLLTMDDILKSES